MAQETISSGTQGHWLVQELVPRYGIATISAPNPNRLGNNIDRYARSLVSAGTGSQT